MPLLSRVKVDGETDGSLGRNKRCRFAYITNHRSSDSTRAVAAYKIIRYKFSQGLHIEYQHLLPTRPTIF
jgi:hypothetical protein